MSSAGREESVLVSALEDFESCLETPIIPGELPSWLHTARIRCKRVADELRHEVTETHNNILRHIIHEDIELAARVDDLEAKDKELLDQVAIIQAEIDRLCERGEQAEPHESKLDDHVKCFTSKALAFIIEARKQEKALTTWYMEALTRDRGVAD
jgi:hypothetical protein